MRSSAPRVSRTEVVGETGAVATGHQAAADAGARVLEEGGNAIDAAVCAAFMSFVVEPGMCGLGGHGRIAIHHASSRTTTAIDHFIVAPRAATPEAALEALARLGMAPEHARFAGALSVGVFGTVAGLAAAHERFGGLPFARLVEPAIEAADRGVEVDFGIQQAIIGRIDELPRHRAAQDHLLPDGRVPRAGDVRAGGDRLDLSDLARTLRAVAERGARALYDGPIAQTIHREMRRLGGLLDAADLKAYRPRIAVDDRYRYRALEVSTCGDTIAIETLNILERFDLAWQSADGAAFRHIFAEAQAQAFVDAFAYAGDPAEGGTPVAGLTSKDYAATLAARIAPSRAQEAFVAGDPWAWQEARPAAGRPVDRGAVTAFEGTTKICAADRRGNAVSVITSLGSAFGSLVLVPGTGIYLGNAMQWFDPRPGRVNSVAPGRMPLYGAPVLIVHDGRGACGALAGSGGYYIQSAVLLPFVYHADLGVGLQAALEMPRQFCRGDALELDSRVGEECRQALVDMGHRVTVVPYSPLSRRFGRSAAVWRDEDGALHAACEPLDGGAAVV